VIPIELRHVLRDEAAVANQDEVMGGVIGPGHLQLLAGHVHEFDGYTPNIPFCVRRNRPALVGKTHPRRKGSGGSGEDPEMVRQVRFDHQFAAHAAVHLRMRISKGAPPGVVALHLGAQLLDEAVNVGLLARRRVLLPELPCARISGGRHLGPAYVGSMMPSPIMRRQVMLGTKK
jgi:hypothetical protein